MAAPVPFLWTHFGVKMHYLTAWSESLRRGNLAEVSGVPCVESET